MKYHIQMRNEDDTWTRIASFINEGDRDYSMKNIMKIYFFCEFRTEDGEKKLNIRDIKFSGKRVDNGEEVQGYLMRQEWCIDGVESEHFFIGESMFEEYEEVIEETVHLC